MTEGYLWKGQYPEAKRVIERGNNQSMELDDENLEYVKEIHKMIQKVAKVKKVDETGFRVITNYGEDGGQTVMHLHYHIIGGKRLGPKIVH